MDTFPWGIHPKQISTVATFLKWDNSHFLPLEKPHKHRPEYSRDRCRTGCPPVISGENTGPTKHRALELVFFVPEIPNRDHIKSVVAVKNEASETTRFPVTPGRMLKLLCTERIQSLLPPCSLSVTIPTPPMRSMLSVRFFVPPRLRHIDNGSWSKSRWWNHNHRTWIKRLSGKRWMLRTRIISSCLRSYQSASYCP